MQGLEVVSWLPPVIISAIVSFVALFIVRYNMQSDRGVETRENTKMLAKGFEEIKRTTQETNTILQDIVSTIKLHDYRIVKLEERLEREERSKQE
jgi:hypothetical protein